MTDKKSFVLYKDIVSGVLELTDEDAGQLFKCIVSYQLELADKCQEILDSNYIIKYAFSNYRKHFDADDKKWYDKLEILRSNGKKGGRPKKATETKQNQTKPNAFLENQTKHDNVNVNVNVNDNNIINIERDIKEHHFENLENDSQWSESVMMRFSLNKKQLTEHIKNFKLEMTAREVFHPTVQNMRNHFTLWIKTELEKKSNGTNRTPKQSAYDADRERLKKWANRT